MALTDTPQYLYKYRCCDANSLSLLAENKLYLARVEAFNDPFEFLNPAAILKAGKAGDPVTTFDKLEKEHRSGSYHSSLRVCALTEVHDELLMWGHYTDCHRGFCIRYEFRNDERIRQKLWPVDYVDDLPDFTKPVTDTNELLRVAALTKCRHWAYEREWRIIGHVAEQKAQTGEQLLSYNPRVMTGIIFGLRTPSAHKALIRKVLRGHPPVQFFQAFKRHDSFALEIREVAPPAHGEEPQ